MKLSLNWLKKYLDISHSPDKIAEMLTLIGLEVDFVSLSNYQIDICYTQGINEDYSYFGGVFVYTFEDLD